MASSGVLNVLGVPIPLGALSLITLTLQNSALTIVLHYVRRLKHCIKLQQSSAELTFCSLCSSRPFSTRQPRSLARSRASLYQPTRCTRQRQQCY